MEKITCLVVWVATCICFAQGPEGNHLLDRQRAPSREDGTARIYLVSIRYDLPKSQSHLRFDFGQWPNAPIQVSGPD
jgi:hypothetical protein